VEILHPVDPSSQVGKIVHQGVPRLLRHAVGVFHENEMPYHRNALPIRKFVPYATNIHLITHQRVSYQVGK